MIYDSLRCGDDDSTENPNLYIIIHILSDSPNTFTTIYPFNKESIQILFFFLEFFILL